MLGLPVLGAPSNVMNITRSMITDYHDKFYNGNNIIVVGTGNIDHYALKKYVNNTFG